MKNRLKQEQELVKERLSNMCGEDAIKNQDVSFSYLLGKIFGIIFIFGGISIGMITAFYLFVIMMQKL